MPPNVTCGPGNLFGLDPLFRDTANHDYSLLPCSPLIGAGSNAAVLGFSTDLAGNPRIQGGTVDIGAYEAPAFGLAAAPQVQPACAGASNGSITVQPVFGCEPYTYDWWPAAGNGPELNGLPPGSYRLTLTDGSGRQVLDTLEVAEAPNPVLSPEAVDVQCTNSLGGSITAATAGGEPPYHYQWWPAAADTSALAQLAAGAYAVTVTDANGCLDSASLELALLGALTLSVDGGSIACFGGTGWLSATPSTGAAPFDWDWAGWPGMGPVAEPLGPGQYAVTVSDAYGCTSAFSFPPMAQPDSLWATVGALPQTDLAAPNGVAVVTTISGGTPSYQYAWSTGGSGQSVEGLTAGAYTVTVTDQHGCAAVTEVTVELMVGTGEAEGRALLLWPNPAADWLKVAVTGSSRARWLDLTDASGRRALRRPMASDECLVDLRGLPGGPYVVTVRDGDGKGLFVGKVLKN